MAENKKQRTNDKLLESNFEAVMALAIPQEIKTRMKYSDADFEAGLGNVLLKEAKLFYCYWVLNEIQKAGTNIVRTKEIFENEVENIQDDSRLHTNIVNAIIDEQNLWIRKLTEILAEVINFSYLKDEIYFEHYILTQRHQAYLRRKNSYKEFFNCDRNGDNKNISDLKQRIEKIEKLRSFDIQKAWYLKSKKTYSNRSGRVISKHVDCRESLRCALKHADKGQKLVLGLGYENYSRLSRDVHPNIGGPINKFNKEIINTNFAYIGLLSGHILLCIKKTFNLKPQKGWLKVLKTILDDNPYPRKLYDSIIKKDIEKGDFVVAQGEICEVVKTDKNKFGYRSFTVFFLERPNNHPCKKDDYLGHELKLLAKRRKLIEDTKKIILEINPNAKLHGNSFIKSYRKNAVRLWNIIKQDTYR